MAYTGEQIQAAIQRQKAIARQRGEARLLRDGQVDYRVDATLYHNAIAMNRRDYGVDNCWAEKEWVRDQVRRHPELRVRNVPRHLRFRISDFGLTEPAGAGRLTRFGRVTFHKRYGDCNHGRRRAG
jgi:hypothetical protein